MSSNVISPSALKGTFHGTILVEGDPDYEERRLTWNRAVDRRPAAIFRCADVDDVVSAVRYTRESNLVPAIRVGGHSYEGYSTVDGGVVIDLSAMNRVDVDTEAEIVTIQGGALRGDVDAATCPLGLVVPTGLISHIGFGGLALGGGVGWLLRKYGMTCDAIRRMEVVTATGDVVYASATENPDLFWGIRGGTGNFGIVTQFECQLFELPPIRAGWIYFDLADAEKVLAKCNALAPRAPRDLGLSFYIDVPGPAAPGVDPHDPVNGRAMAVRVTYTGDSEAELNELLAEIRTCAPVLGDVVVLRDFLELQTEVDHVVPAGPSWFTLSAHARDLNEDLIKELVATAHVWPSEAFEPDERIKRQAVVDVKMLGGAANEVPEDAMAYSGRNAMWLISFLMATNDPSELDWLKTLARETYARMKPHLDLNTSWVSMIVETPLTDLYGEEKFEKLREIKRQWDPDNFFSHNVNIAP